MGRHPLIVVLAALGSGCTSHPIQSARETSKPLSRARPLTAGRVDASVPNGFRMSDDAQGELPRARREEVVDFYHGVRVVDPYRWMETPSTELDKWLSEQDGYTRRVLAAIPGRDKLRDRLRAANRERERVKVLAVIGDEPLILAMRRGADDEGFELVVRQGWEGVDRVLVAPTTGVTAGAYVTVDFAWPSPDGRYVAYGISAAGSEITTIRIVNVATGRILPDEIDRARNLVVSWRPDGRSFFYTRRAQPRPGSSRADWFKRSATYLHVIGGNPERQKPVLAAGGRGPGPRLDPEAWTSVYVSNESRWAIASAASGREESSQFFVAPLEHVEPRRVHWREVARGSDKVVSMLAHGDRVYALTYAGAPNFRLVSFDARSGTVGKAEDFVPESRVVLEDYAAAKDAMYLVALDRGVHRLFRVPWNTRRREEIVLPFTGSVQLQANRRLMTEADRPGVAFSLATWTKPPSWFRFDPTTGVRPISYTTAALAAAEDVVAEQRTAVSRDGTEVPLSILRRHDVRLDRSAPAILYGYGAYGRTSKPTHDPFALTCVREGGVYAICHARGSGARGKAWHEAGIKAKKENGVDDYIACAQRLVRNGYTSTRRLTALGGSAGGLLVGGAITKRPELFRAAVLRVAVLNLLRKETTETGAMNVAEYGSVAVETEFRSMLASDPYHRLREGVAYPAVLLTAGRNDIRVPVWGPAKFAAKLRAASRGGGPVLFRIEGDGGHGLVGSTRTQEEEQYADVLAFALWEAGSARESRRPKTGRADR